MIARRWLGRVPNEKAEAYLALMRSVALPNYEATEGNRGAWCLSRTDGEVTHLETLTFWEDFTAIARFAGKDVEQAKYYDFDADYLLEMEPTVLHFNVD